jgi:alpha-1,3-mannosyltransferase
LKLTTKGLFAYEFVRVDWRAYVSHAFQLNRQFLHKWTVNWRFVPEDIFLSSEFSSSLLAAHALLLLVFCTTRWTKPARRSLIATLRLYLSNPDEDDTDQVADRVTPEFVMTTILSANAVGMLCARSLHYQFYSWAAWATPFLLWRAGFHPVFVYGIWAAQEYAWNVYPSTDLSSAVAVSCLAVTVLGAWWGTRKDVVLVVEPEKKTE